MYIYVKLYKYIIKKYKNDKTKVNKFMRNGNSKKGILKLREGDAQKVPIVKEGNT